MLYILPRLLHNWMSYLLLGKKHWISGMLHLKVGMLYQKLGTLVLKLQARDLHRCTTMGPSVASEMLAWKHHLVFAILFYFF
jgi:hypothetical protein